MAADLTAREKAMQFWLNIEALPATFHLFDGGKVQGKIRGTNSKMEQIVASDLQTPIGVYPHVLLRTTDLTHIEINIPAPKKEES